jgi:hypothetical protein
MKPTATCDCRRVMLLKATTAETSAPTSAPTRKPTIMMPVAVAAQKPSIAESRITPFRERLTTPLRSVSVSPITAITIGAPANKTPAKPVRSCSSGMGVSLYLSREALPHAFHNQDKQHQAALQHASQSRVKSKRNGKLNAPDV